MSKKVRIGNFKGILELEGVDKLKTRFTKWRDTCEKLKGEEIGVRRSKDNLYAMIKKHGVAKRIVFDKKGSKESQKMAKAVGGAHLIPLVEVMFTKSNYDPTSTDAILEIKRLMDDYGRPESPLNPRNITFNGIDEVDDEPMKMRGKVVKDKKGLPVHKIEHSPVYGHYRTKKYVQYRNVYKDKDEFDAKDDKWYSPTKGTAEPPMWQCLYGKGAGKLGFKESLNTIVEDMVVVLQEGKLTITKDTPLPIEGRGAAEKIFNEIPEVREWFERAVRNPQYRTKSGKFSSDAASRFWRNTPLILEDDDESDAIKEIMGVVATKYPADITEVPLKISRGQCRHLANLAGFQEEQVEKMVSNDWRKVMLA